MARKRTMYSTMLATPYYYHVQRGKVCRMITQRTVLLPPPNEFQLGEWQPAELGIRMKQSGKIVMLRLSLGEQSARNCLLNLRLQLLIIINFPLVGKRRKIIHGVRLFRSSFQVLRTRLAERRFEYINFGIFTQPVRFIDTLR